MNTKNTVTKVSRTHFTPTLITHSQQIISVQKRKTSYLIFCCYEKKIEKKTVANLFAHLSGKPGISILISMYLGKKKKKKV
jgi:hypothetical protein